jgi:RNA polymerase sigma-70 factor (sigma-E family)
VRPGDDTYTAYVSEKVPWLRRIAYLLCQDWHRADDLVQVSAAKLYTHWQRVERMENPDAYLRTILLNTYLAEQRTSWWQRVVPIDYDQDALDSVARNAVDLESAVDLAAALAALPPRQRAAVVLRHFCDLSVQDTAELMSISAGSVKSHTSRGLAALRSSLAVGGDR